MAAAEDALSDAFYAALQRWPTDGVPEKPEAWLLTAARRHLIDNARHARVHADASITLDIIYETARTCAESDVNFPDERLKLLFICAHPAIDAAARTPLMLQTVLGLDAERIASAFLVAPTTMSQRLVRAKTKIRDAKIPFDVPEHAQLQERLPAVLDAIYAAYGTGWDAAVGADPRQRGLADEALWLARVVVELIPSEPEAMGLLALMQYCESRRAARRSTSGDYVALLDQDAALWSQPLIDAAEHTLTAALAMKHLGHYQIEAAIQSAHVFRIRSGRDNWESIVALYDTLVQLAPSIGAVIGRAAAMAEHHGAAIALTALDAIDPDSICTYQPYWAVRADFLAKLNRTDAAYAAYTQAIGLAEDPAVRQFLLRKRSALN